MLFFPDKIKKKRQKSMGILSEGGAYNLQSISATPGEKPNIREKSGLDTRDYGEKGLQGQD